MLRWPSRLILAVVAATCLGCGFLEEEKPAPPPKPTAAPVIATPQVEEPPPEADVPTVGERIEIKLAEPVETEQCVAKMVSLGEGRPSVLQLSSYSNAATESFPSIHLRAIVPPEQADSLQGQELSGMLNIQYEPDGPIWYSGEHDAVRLRVIELTPERIECELIGGQLTNITTGETTAATGRLTGAFR